MKTNRHIIVGEQDRCLCGDYGHGPVLCEDIIFALDDLVKHANIEGSGVHLYIYNIRLMDEALRTLVKEKGPS